MNIIELIKDELLNKVKEYYQKHGIDFWEEHIKYVVKNAKELAIKYGGDLEIVELSALLHDIYNTINGPSEDHHIKGAIIAEELLTKYNYPKDKIERVKQCILTHSSIEGIERNTIEEKIIADADVIAHFDTIPGLFYLALRIKNMNIKDGTAFVKKKLENDYNKLSPSTKELLQDRYDNIMNLLFIEE